MLENALEGGPVENPGGQPPGTQEQPGGQPGGGGTEEPAGDETPTEEQQQPGDSPGEQPGADDVLSQEPGEGEPGEHEHEDPRGVQRRITKLTARINQLESDLEKARSERPPPNQQPSPVDSVTDESELERRQVQAEQGVEEAEALLARLSVNPQRVEAELKRQGIKLTDDAGNDDYSTERMADFLTGAKSSFKQTLRAVPQRQKQLAAYNTAYTQAHKLAVSVRPWIGDRTDDRHELVDAIIRQVPQIKNLPNWEYLMVAMVEGHQKFVAEVKAKLPGQNGARHVRPNSGGGAPRRVGPNAKLEAAKAKVLKEGSRAALSEFFAQTSFARS